MGSKSRKLSLIGTIFVSMLSICSAAVSTFAWFQANANVNIQASSTSTSISVSKPKDYTFYYYNGNGNANYSPTGTFASDFSGATSEDFVENQTLWTNIFPGQSMVFAMKIENLNTSSDHVSLAINKFISNDIHKESSSSSSYKRLVKGSSFNDNPVQINIGWAIDVYSLSSSSNTAYYTNSYESSTKNFLETSNTNNSTSGDGIIEDHFAYMYDSSDSDKYSGLISGTYLSPEITSTVNLISNESPTASTMYYFFRVYFSNASSTLFIEKNGDTSIDATVPISDNGTPGRFFVSNSSGTSNCYAGLTFALTKMSLTW